MAREILQILLTDSPGWRLFRLYTPAKHRRAIIDELNVLCSPQDEMRWLLDLPTVADDQIHAFGSEIYNVPDGYSWHINDLAAAVEKHFGYKVGPWGLLPDLDEADQAADWITQEGNAEPGLWIPIALCPVDE